VPLVLVEGNAELSPARLVGHHDPSRILAEGYHADNFVPGPLLEAMTSGSLLYVEELNRVPEETLNVLLGVLSERRVQVPRVGEVVARATFRMVAAMNPYDAVGTGRISPALYDRTCRVAVGYQTRSEEEAVVARRSGGDGRLIRRAVRAVRATREHPDLRIGASVRGAIDLVAVAAQLEELRSAAGSHPGPDGHDAGLDAALAALTGRVTVREGAARTPEEVVTEIWRGSAPGDDDRDGGEDGDIEDGQDPGNDGDAGGKDHGPDRPPARTTPAAGPEVASRTR
jgi:MoxR-like ATPase